MLVKTEKGRSELQPGSRTLGQKERSILLLADGKAARSSLNTLFGGAGEQIVTRLLEQGYLAEGAATDPDRGQQRSEPNPQRSGSADTFSGPRSVASARMFLFDLSDRMFAARDRALADQFRSALREARDVEEMLKVSKTMLAEIERVAGPDRAESISERLAKLLPDVTREEA